MSGCATGSWPRRTAAGRSPTVSPWPATPSTGVAWRPAVRPWSSREAPWCRPIRPSGAGTSPKPGGPRSSRAYGVARTPSTQAGAVALVQLVHLGRETLGAERYYAPVAPSAVRSRREPTAPRALGDAELATLVQAHRVSAEHALETGFDGIELHAAHGYLLAQFLSPVANRRPSARDAAGRAEPVWRIVEAIRDAGPSTLIGIRLSVGDAHDAGLDLEQLGELLALLPPSVDYVNLTVGMRGSYVRDMATEQPPLLADVAALRALTDRPAARRPGVPRPGHDAAGARRRSRPRGRGPGADRRPRPAAQGPRPVARRRSDRASRATRTAAPSSRPCCAP